MEKNKENNCFVEKEQIEDRRGKEEKIRGYIRNTTKNGTMTAVEGRIESKWKTKQNK